MVDILKVLKDELAETCQKAFRRGLVGGAGGNISVRVPGKSMALITATGISLGDIGPEAGAREAAGTALGAAPERPRLIVLMASAAELAEHARVLESIARETKRQPVWPEPAAV